MSAESLSSLDIGHLLLPVLRVLLVQISEEQGGAEVDADVLEGLVERRRGRRAQRLGHRLERGDGETERGVRGEGAEDEHARGAEGRLRLGPHLGQVAVLLVALLGFGRGLVGRGGSNREGHGCDCRRRRFVIVALVIVAPIAEVARAPRRDDDAALGRACVVADVLTATADIVVGIDTLAHDRVD